jgi:hypothetical protein
MYRTNAPEVNTIIGQVVTIVQHTLHILPYDFSLARSKLDEWKCRRRSKQTLSRAPPCRAVFTPLRRQSRSHGADRPSQTLHSLEDFFGSGVTVTKADMVFWRTRAFRAHPCKKLAAGNDADVFLERACG